MQGRELTDHKNLSCPEGSASRVSRRHVCSLSPRGPLPTYKESLCLASSPKSIITAL